eukprot:scaffold1900_cov123-Cylindrotheca_fusiformis.AAC.14
MASGINTRNALKVIQKHLIDSSISGRRSAHLTPMLRHKTSINTFISYGSIWNDSWPKSKRFASNLPSVQVEEDFDIDEFRKDLDSEDEYMLSLLLEYKDRHGDCHVPSGKGSYNDRERERLGVSKELAQWVAKQRATYRNAQGRKGKLQRPLQIKIVLLESLGFMWSDREAQWQRNFNRLEKYAKENNGDLNVDKQEDHQLAGWVEKQRKEYQRGNLSEERANLLKDLNFVFDIREAKWWEYYSKLQKYRQRYGDTLVPADYEHDPQLGNWVSRQRQRRNANELPDDRVKALEEIDFSWDVLNDTWDKNYAELCQFFEEHGHTRVPTTSPLWSWVDRQRRSLRKIGGATSDKEEDVVHKIAELNKMNFDWKGHSDDDDDVDDDDKSKVSAGQINKSRAKKLMELPFKAAIHDDAWVQNFQQLCAFKDTYGHFAVPYAGAHAELSNWVRHQRYLFKRSKLPKERVIALEGIDFAWTAQTARWDRLYEELVVFHAEHGHTRVPSRNSELYRWTLQQRKVLKANEDNPDFGMIPQDRAGRFQELEKILFES